VAVEVGEVVEPHVVGDLADVHVALEQQSARMADADLGDVGHERLAEVPGEEPAERAGRHADQARHLALAQPLGGVVVDVPHQPPRAGRVAIGFGPVSHRQRQGAAVRAARHRREHGQECQDLVEVGDGGIGELPHAGGDLRAARVLDDKPLAGALEQGHQRLGRRELQEAVAEHVARELDDERPHRLARGRS